jgi:F0F1-type ATP synthase assembly protein I
LLLGSLSAFGPMAGVAIGALQDGTARPMGLTIAVGGLLGLTFCLLSTRRALQRATEPSR